MTEPMPEPTDIVTVTPIMYRRDSGHVAVVWSAGRGPVVVQPEAVESWAARVNELVDEVERLQGERAGLRLHLRQVLLLLDAKALRFIRDDAEIRTIVARWREMGGRL